MTTRLHNYSYFFIGLLTVSYTASADQPLSFARDIRPLLSDHCFACHGPDEKQRKADLRLDLAASALESGAVVPGNLNESLVWQRINSTDPEKVMPPADSHKQLTEAQRETLRRWIESGAEYQQHWAFVAPIKPAIPESNAPSPIDAFLQLRMKSEGLEPAPLADRRTLIRRVALDLTGLPPTPAEVAAFEADESPEAYDRLISGLISRVRYGEHQARYWLDLARYADTHGMHLDNERSMWPFRDWVVRAFNENLPFDDFTRWQLAGDLMAGPTRDQLIASGFNRCNVTTGEGGSIDEEWIYRYAVDRTTTAAEVWMGLTAGCAVCHDHKFDPISARDYYSMYAFFHSAADPAMDGNRIDTPPILKLPSDADKAKLADLEQRIADVESRLKETLAKLTYVDPAKLVPPPEPSDTSTVWFEDGFPQGAAAQVLGDPLTLVNDSVGHVFSGKLALRRTTTGLAQDYYNSGAAEFTVPNNGKVFVHCFLDSENKPETIMIQFHTDGWKHRAVWGAEAKIGFGQAGTPEKVLMGDLPEVGKWVRLEVDAEKMGLLANAKIKGYAFTQFGGTVTWDLLGVSSKTDTAKDPSWSFEAWKAEKAGKSNAELPEGLKQLVQNKKVAEWSEEESQQVFNHWLRNIYAGAESQLAGMKSEKAALEQGRTKTEQEVPITFVMADLPQQRESFVMLRGAYNKPGEKVKRGVPSFLPPLPPPPEGRDYNRLDLANWLVSGEHPLTARVIVNRIWQQFFGTGLVKTSADFGSQGEPPSHPQLLDWLAVNFVEEGWDVQKLIKLILNSHAYRQTSQVSPKFVALDPANRLLARGPRLRLDAEVLRDQALFVSGLLVDKVGGKAVNPYQPPNIWEPVAFGGSNTQNYRQGTGSDLYRRSLYTFLKRTAPPPFMSSFDAPNREQSCSRRERSNSPMQALQLMNDIQHFEAARNFASRILLEGGSETKSRIQWAWLVAISRQPTNDELEIVAATVAKHLQRYKNDPEAAKQVISYGESKSPEGLDLTELAAYTLLANLILNMDETVNKN